MLQRAMKISSVFCSLQCVVTWDEIGFLSKNVTLMMHAFLLEQMSPKLILGLTSDYKYKRDENVNTTNFVK